MSMASKPQVPEREHAGRVAIVTGASSGIGRATAIKLAAAGATVLGVARTLAKLSQLADEHPGIVAFAASIDTPDACADVVAAARHLGPPTILVNSAGLGGYLDQPIFEQTSAAWHATMAVNLHAPFELSRLVARHIRDQGFGRIVMISSTAGEVGAPSMSPYCASKHAVIGLMRSIAHDIAPCGGTCNAVLPGWVKSAMAQLDVEQEAARRGTTADLVWQEIADKNPGKRILTPEEIADVVVFLTGNASRGINGEAMTVSIGSIW